MPAASFTTLFQALRELGLKPLLLNGLYRIGLRSGHYRRATPAPTQQTALPDTAWVMQPVLDLPDAGELQQVLGAADQERLLQEADEIVSGKVRLFGGEPQPLQLAAPGPLHHWTAYEGRHSPPAASQAESSRNTASAPAQDSPQIEPLQPTDIKFTWEPARFGWAFTLGRAYRVFRDERYPQAFWSSFETFQQHNPPFQGPNWQSAQEVALRLMALAFAGQVFAASPHSTPQRMQTLAQAIAAHAQRIPPTLIYARSQNNNHLLSEAAGLYIAGLLLPRHPAAPSWRALGWRWFNRGVWSQVEPNGVYMQHSVNYHRLMLQLGLWMNTLARKHNQAPPALTLQRLGAATSWLLAFLDPDSGRTPNLGANDGAYILPFSSLPFQDYRPVAQAAAAAFLQYTPLPGGTWDEMRLWLAPDAPPGISPPASNPAPVSIPASAAPGAPIDAPGLAPAAQTNVISSQQPFERALGILRHPAPGAQSWAYLRLAQFHDRPGHADLLHLDLWRKGVNLALDAGTYLYNAPSPWDNALTHTSVHNTVLVDGQEQMRRAGRFLYLDWAQTQTVPFEQPPEDVLDSLAAVHDGYRRLGVLHRRQVSALADGGWLVQDALLPAQNSQASTSLPLSAEKNRPAASVRRSGAQDSLTAGHLSHKPGARDPSDAHTTGGPTSAVRHSLVLHWLLPDCPWRAVQQGLGWEMRLDAPGGPLELSLQAELAGEPLPASLQIARAGLLLFGDSPVRPTWGWISPTYGDRIPALSLRFSLESSLPVKFTSRWAFPA